MPKSYAPCQAGLGGKEAREQMPLSLSPARRLLASLSVGEMISGTG